MEFPEFDAGPHQDLMHDLRAVARAGGSLLAILELARSRLDKPPGEWEKVSLLVRSFDLTLQQAGALADWDGWSTKDSATSEGDLAQTFSALVPRTSEMPAPDFGADGAKQLAKRLRASMSPLWVGVRRELSTRVELETVALADCYRGPDGLYTFLAWVRSDIVLFAYRGPEGARDLGPIEEWANVSGSDLARRYHFVLEHARRLRDGTASG